MESLRRFQLKKKMKKFLVTTICCCCLIFSAFGQKAIHYEWNLPNSLVETIEKEIGLVKTNPQEGKITLEGRDLIIPIEMRYKDLIYIGINMSGKAYLIKKNEELTYCIFQTLISGPEIRKFYWYLFRKRS